MAFSGAPYARSMADLLLAEGAARADAARQKGAIWGQTMQSLSQIPGQVMAMRQGQQDRAVALEDAQTRRALIQGQTANLLRDDERAAAAAELDARFKRADFTARRFAPLLNGADDETYAAAVHDVAQLGVDVSAFPKKHSPGFVRSLVFGSMSIKDQLEAMKPQIAPAGSGIIQDGELTGQVPFAPRAPVPVAPGARLVNPETGTTVAEGGPPLVSSQTHTMRLRGVGDVPVDYIPGRQGDPGRWMYQGQDVTGRVSQIPPATLQVNAAGADDIETQAQMVVEGHMPPSLLSKRSSSYNAIIAAANRLSKTQHGQPINIGQLENEYFAARRWVAGMNGPQMIRFKGLAVSVVNTITEVNRLADELKQGGVQKWNNVTRRTIQQAYGNTPQSQAANNYMVALNTLKEEFANLAQGGYAPTEDAWKLANQQINGDLGFKDLTASLAEVQRLIRYRLNAFEEVTPSTLSPTMSPANSTAPELGVTPPNPFRSR